MTKAEVLALDIGDVLERTFDVDGFSLQARPGARYGTQGAVAAIHKRGTNYLGKAFVCGYTTFGPNSNISFTAREGDDSLRLVAKVAEKG